MESRENILSYDVERRGAEDVIGEISAHLDSGEGGKWLACLNPHSYTVALGDRRFAEALKASDWLIPDGVGVVIASKILGGAIRDRITGADIFLGLQKALDGGDRGGKVFFLGASEDTLAIIRKRMSADFPNLEVVGTYSPPYKPEYTEEELNDMREAINAVSPDILWVGMTAPKQEKWILDNLGLLDVRFAAAIGAVFDFYAGKVKRSHPVFQKVGLEWLPRLLQEPRRLWRRMFVSAPVFMSHVLRARLFS